MPNVLLVEQFTDAAGLFLWCEQLGLEGIVSKRANSLYHSGKQRDWRKVKCAGLAEGKSQSVEVCSRGADRRGRHFVGNGATPMSPPTQPGSCSVAPLPPHLEQRARWRSTSLDHLGPSG